MHTAWEGRSQHTRCKFWEDNPYIVIKNLNLTVSLPIAPSISMSLCLVHVLLDPRTPVAIERALVILWDGS